MPKLPKGSMIGIIGGGQLGKMTAEAAHTMGYKTHIYCPDDNSPATLVSDKKTIAQYDNEYTLASFADDVDIVTFEFENIPVKSIKFLEERVLVRPSWKILEISQNRLREKRFLNSIDVQTAPFYEVHSAEDLQSAMNEIGSPKAILKTTEMGYDGKGQFVIESNSDLQKIWKDSGMSEGVLEGFIAFKCEISAIIARNEHGEIATYPPAENVHKNGILDISTVPASISDEVIKNAQKIAEKIAESLNLIGILAVEFFVTQNDELIVNELAPRPHNSGHWTMDASATSQFEQFVRAVCGLPLGSVKQTHKVKMRNLIGEEVNSHSFKEDNNTVIHLYGKKHARTGRKMGHINFIDD